MLGSQSSVSTFCFALSSLAAIAGMTMGIVMGLKQDFQFVPVHVHLNLLGWVGLMLYGLYYRTHDSKVTLLAKLQVIASSIGAFMFPAGLAGMFRDEDSQFFFVLVLSGTLLALAGAVMFAVVAWRK
jgi:hypothetical protein